MSASATTAAQSTEILDDIRSMAGYRLFPVILESMLFAFYIVLMVFHCAKYRKDKERVFGIFAISVCLFTMLLPSRLSPDGADVPIDDALRELNGNVRFARDTCASIIFVFCDLVSLWRAYVIYGKPRWLRIVCWVLFVISCILYIVDSIFQYTAELETPPKFALYLSQLDDAIVLWTVGAMTFSTTAFSQVFATVLIARKAWTYRKEMQRLLPAHKGAYYQSQRLITVLYVVIETGILYSLLWILNVLANNGLLGLTNSYWAYYWICPISGIYPTLIVVVVSQRASILEQSATNASGLEGITIRFATNDDPEASRPAMPDKPQPELSREDVTVSDQSL